MTWTHKQLCDRAIRWLSGTRRCEPVYAGNASCGEIPDAIGWSSSYSWYGSTVIECKTSVDDFYADKNKRFRWLNPQSELGYKHGYTRRELSRFGSTANNFQKIEVPMMGDFRFYMCPLGTLTSELVAKHAPDHGLLVCFDQRCVRIMRPAPRRVIAMVDKDSEIRYLRFAIINAKSDASEAKQEPLVGRTNRQDSRRLGTTHGSAGSGESSRRSGLGPI